MMTCDVENTSVLCSVSGCLGMILLNRPKALNALDLGMIRKISLQLDHWALDQTIQGVLVAAVPGKAFCAGGDVRTLAGLVNYEEKMQFFQEEYRLNLRIAEYPKPYIALMNGLTMGGGVGIGMHGHYPIATNQFVFSMPETRIGFFPDIGASYLLSRCPEPWGLYLALTGERISAEIAQQLGLIYGIIESDNEQALIQALSAATSLPDEISMIIESYCVPYKQNLTNSLAQNNSTLQTITECFSKPSIEEIARCYSFSAQAPLSLKVTFQQLKRAKNLSLAECLEMDYRLVSHFMKDPNFYEGVRALLIDKDNQPRWQPDCLDSVRDEDVKKFFK